MSDNLCADSLAAKPPTHQSGDGGSSPTSALHLWNIREVPRAVAKPWIEKWHYSRRIPSGKNYLFGLFTPSNELYAVAVYGIGVNPYQARFLKCERVLELKRLARSEPARPEYPMSRFVAITTKMLRKQVQFDCLVSFSDPEEGHAGTLYKACGFAFAGLTNPEWHLIDAAGNKRHRRFAYRYAKRKNMPLSAAREALGLARTKTQPKKRWVKFFGPVGTRVP